MQEIIKILKDGPGTIKGISTTRSHRGTATIFDGDKPKIEIDLGQAMPTVNTEHGEEPGLDLDIFCKKSIKIRQPKGIDIQAYYE